MKSNTIPTVPEKPIALWAQMQWLIEGKRKAVLVTPGERLPEIPARHPNCIQQYMTHGTGLGLFIYNAVLCTVSDIERAIRDDKVGEFLGYGIPSKPKDEIGAVVMRNGAGQEKLSVVTDAQYLPAVTTRLKGLADPDDSVGLEPCEKVVEERLRGCNAMAALPELRPLRTAEEREQVHRAAAAENHRLFCPTHWIQKEGHIAGAAEVSSIPLCTVWFGKAMKPRDTMAILNVLENGYRSAGTPVAATLVEESSPFAPVMERLGYQCLKTARVYLKKL